MARYIQAPFFEFVGLMIEPLDPGEKRLPYIFKHLSLCLVGFMIGPPDPGEKRWPDICKHLSLCPVGFMIEPPDPEEKKTARYI